MKFRRKPVARVLVDALKGEKDYTVQWPGGEITQVPIQKFDEDFAPAHASPRTKRKGRTKPNPSVPA